MRRCLHLGLCALLWILESAPAAAQDVGGAKAVTLTNAAQVRALSQETAAQHLPVRLRGVVIGEAEPQGRGLSIQDETAGIYLEGPANQVSGVRRGDEIDVAGVTDPGDFAPFVQIRSLRKLGTRPVPKPLPVTYDQLITGGLDAQWVEIQAVVRRCERITSGPYKWRLFVSAGGGQLKARLMSPENLEALVDAEVRLRGVCYYNFNKSRQVLGAMLAVPREVPVEVIRAAPADPYAMPESPAGSLLQFTSQGNYGHRVRVHGVVTHWQKGEAVWIRSAGRGLCAHTRQEDALKTGDEIDVLGFPAAGEYTPVLEDASFRKRMTNLVVSPVRLTNATEALDHDADLVEMEALLLDRRPMMDGWIFGMRGDDGREFTCMLRQSGGQTPSPAWQPGSRVRLAGICAVHTGEGGVPTGVREPLSFHVLLRTPDDLRVVQPPPWWTRRRIVWLCAVIAAASLLAVAGVMWQTRRHLREQERQRARSESEFSAILAERNRMAREIHDTLAQGLSAISMQLELVKDRLPPGAESAARHLEQAHRQARSSLADARNSIWNMRSQVLENGDLASALSNILKQMTEGKKIASTVQVTGSRRLPPVTENNLLRIGQESITNAIKHARAGRIEVLIEFGEKQVRLRVRDDGCGFDPGQPPKSQGGFGLVGMRERAAQLQGELTVQSASGKGTEVTLTLPC